MEWVYSYNPTARTGLKGDELPCNGASYVCKIFFFFFIALPNALVSLILIGSKEARCPYRFPTNSTIHVILKVDHLEDNSLQYHQTKTKHIKQHLIFQTSKFRSDIQI